MFTGIVREVGTVVAVDGGEDGVRVVVEAPATAAGVGLGDSVSLGGVCLTVTANESGTLAFDAVPETLRRTSLGRLEAGSCVNLEPALRAGDPLGGHIVQGHVDDVGRVASVEPEGDGGRVTIEAPSELRRYLVEKGSITVEGVSLTVAELTRRLRRRADPAHACRHDPRRARGRRPGQPRGRRARQVRRAPARV